MKTTVQNVWLKKAGALVACSVFLGAPTAALANGGGGNLPVASSIPVGHFPTAPTQHHVVQSGATTSVWGSPSGGTTSQNGHISLKGLLFPAIHSLSNTGNQANLWHGQQFLSSLPHTGNTNSAQSLFAGNSAGGPSGPGLQLDLTSTSTSIVLGTSIFQGKSSVTIDLGGTREVFSAGAQVTPAEYVAIRQVLGGAQQTLSLNSQGTAVGGSFSLNAVSSAQITELVIPTGVTALDYASRGTGLGIAGDVLNYGTIDGVAGRGQGSTVSLNAQDIINESGGLISTKLSSTLASSLGGVLSPVNLALSAVDNISNSGNIVSSGSLSLVTTNGSINNGKLASGTSSGGNSGGTVGTGSGAVAPPTIQAVHDVSLSTGSGNLINSGLITSSAGNININTANVTNDINIYASGGTFQALAGNINVREASYSGSNNINLNGGNYLSQNLNLYTGTGTIDGSVGQLTGTLNTAAGADHLQAATATLMLGNNTVSGDPTFVNSQGDIEIVGINTFGEDVSIIASGNITASANGQIIDNGNNVTLIAGANITSSSPADNNGTVSGNVGTSPYPGSAQNSVTITPSQGGSATGGNIDLSASTVTNVIDTSSANSYNNGGNVTLVAFGAGATQTTGGTITLGSGSTINANGGSYENGGNVTIIAGGNPSTATPTVQIGAINTGGGGNYGGQGGTIGIYTAVPSTSDSNPITFGTNGAITSGNIFVPGAVNAAASIVAKGDLVTAPFGQTIAIGGITSGAQGANAGSITISAGNSITTQNVLAFGGGGAGGDSNNPYGGYGGNGANISISVASASGSITVNGQINSSGGGGGGAGSGGSFTGMGGYGGSAGTISVVQGAGGSSSPGTLLLQTTGGIFAASGGAGGSTSATFVGGGGASYGGGGGGGSSGTGGTPGVPGTAGTTGGGAGGAGFFGGGGGDVDGAGGGGGYTGGSAGGSQLNATAGTANTGGNGVAPSGGPTPTGGQLAGPQQGGQASVAGSGAGANIPLTSGGNTVTLSSVGVASIGGDIAGNAVSISTQGNLTFQGNVFGVTSITVNDGSGSITQTGSGLFTLGTPSLTFNVGSVASPVSITASTSAQNVVVAGYASNIAIAGPASNVQISDAATSASFDGSELTAVDSLSITMSATNATINIAAIPSTVTSLIINAGADPTNGGTINFEPSSVSVGSGSITLTANNITWTGEGSGALTISANSGAGQGRGGTVSITTNEVNSSTAISIGNVAGDLNLSATAVDTGVAGGSITIVAPTSSLTVDANYLQVGSNATSGSGGSIALTAGTIAASTGALTLNVDGVGSGSGGKISLTETNTTGPVTLGGPGIILSAQGGTSGGNGGSIAFSTNGELLLTTDANGNVVGASDSVMVGPSSQAVNGNGGSLSLTATSFANADSSIGSTQPLIFNVSGQGTGSGGSIRINQLYDPSNPSGSLTIGISATATVTDMDFVAANGSSGSRGGTVIVTLANNPTNNSAGTLIVNPAAITETVSSSGNSNVISGGVIELVAPTIVAASVVSTKSPLVLNVNGVGAGDGGDIIIEESNATTAPTGADPTGTIATMVIGTKAGQFELLAAGGTKGTAMGQSSGGEIIASSGGNLTVSPSGIDVQAKGNGNGGTISLSAINSANATGEGDVLVTGALNVNASGKGTGGTIGLSSNSSTAFDIGLSSKNTNGVEGGLSMTGGNGGQLNINTGGTGGITIQTAIKSAQFVVINATNASGNVDINAALGSGKSGEITITTNANIATGEVNINSTLGGTTTSEIYIDAPNTSIIGGAAGKLITSTTGTSPGFIDLTAGENISGLTTTTNGGVSTTKQLQMVTTALTATANATTGVIAINDAIGVNSTLTLNGLNAGDSINLSCGGSITTAGNSSGDVVSAANPTLSNSAAVNSSTPAGVSGADLGSIGSAIASVIMNAIGTITGTLTASTANIKEDNDEYKLPPSPELEIHTNAFGFGDGPGFFGIATVGPLPNGFVGGNSNAVTALAPSSNTLGTFTILTEGRDQFFLSGTTSMVLTGTFGNSTSAISIQSTEAGASITGTALLSGKSVSLLTNGGYIGASQPGGAYESANYLQVKTSDLSVNTGGTANANLNNQGKSILEITSAEVASLNVITAGGVSINSLNSADISVTASGTSTVQGLNSTGLVNINNTKGLLTVLNLTAASNVSITSIGGANLTNVSAGTGIVVSDEGKTTATTLATISGGISVASIGTGAVSLTGLTTTSAGNIEITTGGTATLADFNSSGAITVVTGGATEIGSLSTNGSTGGISLTNATGLLQTSVNAEIYSLNGGISLENENTKSGSIVIGTGSNIETGTLASYGGTFPGTGSQVSITIGAVPLDPIEGTAPSGVTPSQSGIFWGQYSITAIVTKTAASNTITSQNADVVFNTGQLKASAIKLDGGTTIIADPPGASILVEPAVAAAAGGLLSVVSEPTLSSPSSGFHSVSEPALAQGGTSTPLLLSLNIPVLLATNPDSDGFNGALLEAAGLANGLVCPLSAIFSENITAPLGRTAYDPEARWISETEIESGAIPAVLSSEEDFGIQSDISSVLRMTESKDETKACGAPVVESGATMPNGETLISCGKPLSGHIGYFNRAEARHITLTKGAVVFASSKRTVVDTPFCTINLAEKSLVLVLAMQDALAVYDFDDTHHAAVSVVAGSEHFVLAPGRHVLFSKSSNTFEQVNAAQLFAFRGINQHSLSGTEDGSHVHAFTAEFDLLQAINTVMPLHQLANSDNSRARTIARHLFKTTGIMAELTVSGEQYHQVLRPNLVATRCQ